MPLECKGCGEELDDDCFELCEDCQADFDADDLETQLDRLMHTYEPKEKPDAT